MIEKVKRIPLTMGISVTNYIFFLLQNENLSGIEAHETYDVWRSESSKKKRSHLQN